MLPQSQAPKCSNFVISDRLLVILLSPLPRCPGYSVKCWVNHPAGNRAGYSLSYPVRNPESYGDDYPVSYWAGYLPENLVSYPVGYPDSNSAGCSADCGENRPGRNPESNRGDSWADYSESYWVDSLPDCWVSYSGSFDARPVSREAASRILLQFDDLDAEAGTGLDDIDAGRKHCSASAPVSARSRSGRTVRNHSPPASTSGR